MPRCTIFGWRGLISSLPSAASRQYATTLRACPPSRKAQRRRAGKLIERPFELDDDLPVIELPPRNGHGLADKGETVAPLKASRFTYRDPATIPARQFLYGRHSIRGFLSVTAA